MSTKTIRNFRDTWVDEAAPNATHGGGKWVRVLAGAGVQRRAFVRPPLRGILGRTVLSATLYGHAAAAAAAQIYTVRRVSDPPGAFKTMDWGGQPGTVTPDATSSPGALVAGDEVSWDVTDLVAPVAAGSPWYGFRITTDGTGGARFWSQDSGETAWRLVVELSDEPETPDGQAPDGGSVSSGAPILSWTPSDLGGTTDQASLQVQADPAADEVTPDFDSGTVVSVDPMLDLSTTAFTPLLSSASTQWRVRVLSEGGVWSEWSDWVTFTYTPKPVLTITQPTASIYDPTPPFEGNIDSGTLESIRLLVTPATDTTNRLWDSGRLDASGTTFAEIVDEYFRGRRVLRDDQSYRFVARVWDEVDRAPGVIGDPTYIEATVIASFDEDLAVEAPADYTITQGAGGSPVLTHTFTRSVDPDTFVVRRDGKVIARLDPADLNKVGTTYTWVDGGIAPAYFGHTYTVRAIVNNRASAADSVLHTSEPDGVWLIRRNGDTVKLDGTGVGGFRMLDRVATYKLINLDRDVDIHYGSEGIAGPFAGTMADSDTQSIDDALAVLEAIDQRPNQPVRVVWASESIWARLRHLTFVPDSEFLPGSRRHVVSFELSETSEDSTP